MGFGSTSVALITDFVFANDLMLHYSMAIVGALSGLLGLFFLLAAAADLPQGHGRAQPALTHADRADRRPGRAADPADGAGLAGPEGGPGRRGPAACFARTCWRSATCPRTTAPPWTASPWSGAPGLPDSGNSRWRECKAPASPPGALSNAGVAWRIATGAPLPRGADTVVPVERLSETRGGVRIDDDYRPKRGQFIHRQGFGPPGRRPAREGGPAHRRRRNGAAERQRRGATAGRPRSPHRPGFHRRRTRRPGLPPRKAGRCAPATAPPCRPC